MRKTLLTLEACRLTLHSGGNRGFVTLAGCRLEAENIVAAGFGPVPDRHMRFDLRLEGIVDGAKRFAIVAAERVCLEWWMKAPAPSSRYPWVYGALPWTTFSEIVQAGSVLVGHSEIPGELEEPWPVPPDVALGVSDYDVTTWMFGVCASRPPEPHPFETRSTGAVLEWV